MRDEKTRITKWVMPDWVMGYWAETRAPKFFEFISLVSHQMKRWNWTEDAEGYQEEMNEREKIENSRDGELEEEER